MAFNVDWQAYIIEGIRQTAMKQHVEIAQPSPTWTVAPLTAALQSEFMNYWVEQHNSASDVILLTPGWQLVQQCL